MVYILVQVEVIQVVFYFLFIICIFIYTTFITLYYINIDIEYCNIKIYLNFEWQRVFACVLMLFILIFIVFNFKLGSSPVGVNDKIMSRCRVRIVYYIVYKYSNSYIYTYSYICLRYNALSTQDQEFIWVLKYI